MTTLDDLDTMMANDVNEADQARLEPTPATLDQLERDHILMTMRWANHNKARAAAALGITAKTLYNKLHRYGYMDNPSAFR